MTQGSLIPLCDQALAERIITLLGDGHWWKRDILAVRCDVSVRAIRDAASHAGGRIISSNSGLKLTSAATPEEVNEATGRFRSQIHEMQRRLIETEQYWHARRWD